MKNMNNSSKIKLVQNQIKGKNILPFPFLIESCKKAFTTRNVDLLQIKTLITGDIKPRAGDLVLCEVKRLRQHCRIEQPNGRRSRMFEKDKIIVCYGNRYAPDQFEAIVPNNLDACHLVAGGGIAAMMRHKNPKVKPATEIQPLGLIGDYKGQVLNLSQFSLINKTSNNKYISKSNIPVILVAGSSMNAGKTTTVASLIKGLTADGYSVGAAKVTGTGSGCDLWHFKDAGIEKAYDFTDLGHASTYLLETEVLVGIFTNIVNHLIAEKNDIIVIEVADGILQKETKSLLETEVIKEITTAIYYSSGDSSSAIFGSNWLNNLGYNVLGISGVVSSNPLARLEIEQSTTIPVIEKSRFMSAGFGHKLFEINSIVNSKLNAK